MVVGGEVRTDEIIEICIESAARHFARAECFQRSRGCIARIGEQRLLVELPFAVEPLEGAPGHEHFASYLKKIGPSASLQLQRDAPYGLYVLGHHVAAFAVAACDGAHQPSMLIDERYRSAVEFHFTHNVEVLAAQSGAHAVKPFVHLLDAVGVGQRQHGVNVFHLFEAFGEVAPHAVCGRQRVVHVGMLRFQGLKFLHEHVEILV